MSNYRDNVKMIYVFVMVLYWTLDSKGVAPLEYVYNMALIKKFLKLTRSELVKCYEQFGKVWEKKDGPKDVDDIADIFEPLTSEEKIKAIEAENPSFAYIEQKQEPVVATQPQKEEEEDDDDDDVDHKEAIAQLYYGALKESGSDAENFRSAVFLADQNPNAVRKAVNYYARDCGEEEAVLVFDATVMKSGKSGLLLTNKFLYIGISGRQQAKIALPDINFLDVEAGMLVKQVTINSFDVETVLLGKKGTVAFANLLDAVIPVAMQIEVDTEKE